MVSELRFKRPEITYWISLWILLPNNVVYWLAAENDMWHRSTTVGAIDAHMSFDELTEEEQYKVCEWLVQD